MQGGGHDEAAVEPPEPSAPSNRKSTAPLRYPRLLLGAILLAALILRLGWVWHVSVSRQELSALPDQVEYFDLGRHLRGGEGLWFFDARFQDRVYAYRTPLYPMFLAACGTSPMAIRIVQGVLDTATVLAIFLLARRWLPKGPSLFAAALVAFNPYLIYFSGLLLTETLFTAMLAWGMVLIVRSGGPWPARKSLAFAWLGGALLLALSVLVRPGALLLPVALGIAAAFAHRTSPQSDVNREAARAYRWWQLPPATTLLVLTGLVLLPWAVRNEVRVHSWVWTTTDKGITRYDGFNPDATGASDQAFVKRMPLLNLMDEVARDRYLSDLADEYVRAHPLRDVQLAGMKIARTWSPVPLSQQFGSRRLLVVIGLCFGLPVDLLILAGLLRRRLPRSAKALLLVPAIYFTAAATLSVGSLRYRIPADPPMAILAAASIAARRSATQGEHAQESQPRPSPRVTDVPA